MCTAISFLGACRCFGRNLDLEFSYGECVTVTPRHFPFHYRHLPTSSEHYAIIGMAKVTNNYPLYFDAMNEHGLAMAGLNFVGNAVYQAPKDAHYNLATFELIPYLLGECKTVSDVKVILSKTRILGDVFSEDLPTSQLHWMVSDRDTSIVIECVKDGLFVYDNPFDVLTNNPPFPFQAQNLCSYRHLSPSPLPNHFSNISDLPSYSNGMGAIGLPGDFSSVSRFVRAAFVRANSSLPSTSAETVGQFFHLLSSVAQPLGCVHTDHGLECTQYSSCCDLDSLTYYYRTYANSQISAVRLLKEEQDGSVLSSYPLLLAQELRFQN